jgi:hypothetical protein
MDSLVSNFILARFFFHFFFFPFSHIIEATDRITIGM